MERSHAPPHFAALRGQSSKEERGDSFVITLAETGEFGGTSATHTCTPWHRPPGQVCVRCKCVAEPVEGSLMLPRLVALAGGFGFFFVEFEVLGLAADDVQLKPGAFFGFGG